jgi:hypothetical protein
MTKLPTPQSVADQNAFLSAIGHICLQWALLEQSILYIIGAIENLPMQKAYAMVAGMDIQPRLNLAIELAQQAGLPHLRFIKPLQNIRKELQRSGSGLADRRNMFVHGAHKFGENEGEYILKMSRWKGDKQSTTVTLLDAAQLANEIALQAQKAHSIFDDYGLWKFGAQNQTNSSEHIAYTKAVLRLIRREQIKRALKLLFANLKPW